jgi:hypothetical protein
MNFLKPVKFQKLNRFFIYTFNCLFHNKKKVFIFAPTNRTHKCTGIVTDID